MMIHNKDRKISFVIAVFTFLTLIFCCNYICEAAGTKLVWEESPESNVEGYYLYYGTEPENYTDSVQVVGKTTTSYLIANFNFTTGQTYYIVITAYTDTGEESIPSNEILYEEIKPETVTGLQSPTHSIGECSSNPEIAVQWIAAVDTGGSGLDGYSIVWNTESDTLPDTTKDIEDVTAVTSSSLSDGSYYFHIRSLDNALNWSDAAEHLGPFCIDTAVPSNVPPTASFIANPTIGDAPLSVQFTDTSIDPDGTVASWNWDFGDGGTSTAQNPGHTYNSAGTYTVTLTVTDDDDATDSAFTTISVSSGEEVSIYIEAESGTLESPIMIGNDPNPTASGGKYVYAPAGSGDTINPTPEAVYNIDISYAGDYYLWLRMYGPTGDNDAMYIGFNGNFDRVYTTQWTEYEWVRVETEHGSGIFAHTLSAGTNQINIGHGEELARVDIILVTDDPDFVPSGIPADIAPKVPSAPSGLGVGVSE